MPREQGFPIADVDTSLFDDPKVRKLWRRCQGDEATMTKAVVTYLATLLESWATGERVYAEDAAPAWLEHSLSVGEALLEVGLLDAEGRLPEKSWEGWYGPAFERREARRESGRQGGLKSRSSDAQATVKERLSDAEPVRTVPTVPSVPTEPAARGSLEPRSSNPRTIGNLNLTERAIIQAKAVLADKLATDFEKENARHVLEDLGVAA